MNRNTKRFRVAIDTGGTFVDAIEFDELKNIMRLAKSPTTPSDPVEGVLNVLKKLDTPLEETYMIIYGTTLGLNSILQRKGANTGLITNEGFRDIFEIGRGDVPPKHMYDFNYAKPDPLIKRRNIVGVPGRINYKGEVIKDLDLTAIKSEVDRLIKENGIQSLAICFLHSYRNPEHEYKALDFIRKHYPLLPVSISCEVVREYREYERTSTTVLDAYIKPIVSNHIARLEKSLRERGFDGIFLIMRSDGGVMSAEAATKSPIRTLQSGPAGGVIGACYYARILGLSKVISIDIGGTSMDACIILDNNANVVHEIRVEHYPILLTTFDIRSIGAGGGSIARLDAKLLTVGPASAGADPGPMCYGRGGKEPTLTDAAVCLGYIDPNNFLYGEMRLNSGLAIEGIKQLIAEPLGISVEDAAAGIFKIMAANTCAAIRQITVEEGMDPAEFTMIGFGGAGPLLASFIAHEIGIPKVIIPTTPAHFSAFGMLMADLRSEMSQTILFKLNNLTIKQVNNLINSMSKKLLKTIEEQSGHYISIEVLKSLELRYVGQEHTLELYLKDTDDVDSIKKRYNELHFKKYGHMMDYDLEIVNARVIVKGILRKPSLNTKIVSGTSNGSTHKGTKRMAYCLVSDKFKEFKVLDRHTLDINSYISGPAIIEEGSSTTVIHSNQLLTVDQYGNILVEV